MLLPQAFIDSIAPYPLLQPLSSSLLTEPETSVRLNLTKLAGRPLSMHKLAADPAQCQAVAWCPAGLYLPQRPAFTADPQLHQGLYYVQDASSMAITAAIEALLIADPALAQKPLRYLDCCAAPGGKTTAAASAVPHGSLVVANEYDFKRSQILAENMAKWGYSPAMATRGDTAALRRLASFFDVVAVDAPCSGEGMMRKDATAREQWSQGLVTSCAALQRSILENAYSALRPGGWLIYSTCTFNRTENEENVQWLVDTFSMESMPIPALDSLPEVAPAIDSPLHCYRFIPGRTRGEGLFMALLRKAPDAESRRCQLAKPPRTDAAVAKQVKDWLEGNYVFKVVDSEVYAWPESRAQEMATVADALSAFMPGLHVASLKGKDAVPAHELALSSALRPGAFPTAEVTEEQALCYLRRESVTLPSSPKGYVLLTYGGFPLGFVKNLGNRANNLYPKNWRIRN